MAVVQYTAVVNQIRGKLNGSTFNKYKTGFSLTKKQQPPQGFRGNQLQRRAGFSRVQRFWKGLSEAQQNSWIATAAANPVTNRFGEQVHLSGYNYFIKANLKHFQQTGNLRATSTGTASPSSGLLGLVLSAFKFEWSDAQGAIMSLHASATVTSWFSGIRFAVYVSLPQSTGVTNYQRGYRYLDSIAATATVNADFTGVLGKRYPAIAAGTVLFFLVETWHTLTGATLYREQVRFVVPEFSAIDSWSVPATSPSQSPVLTIAYSPVSTGFPSFMHVAVWRTAPDITPPPQSAATIPQPQIEADLATANTGSQQNNAYNGAYIGYLAQLIWSPTGEVVDERYTVYQRVF